MNFLEIIGLITILIFAIIALLIVYVLIRAVFRAADFVCWQYAVTKRTNPELKFKVSIFIRGVAKNWYDMIDHSGTTYSKNGSEWTGFGSWR